MTKTKILIPFDESGNLISDPIDLKFRWRIPDPSKVTWKENVPFEDDMRIGPVNNANLYHTTKSSTFCEITSLTTGRSFPIYMSDLMNLITLSNVLRGEVSGTWAFTRHSSKISLLMVAPGK